MTGNLKKELPDGTFLIAESWDEPDYPGIRISNKKLDGTEEFICFVEFNSAKPEGKQLCIAAYSQNIDEPAYYESYNDLGVPSINN